MTIPELIEILKAAEAGKVIERKPATYEAWHSLDNLDRTVDAIASYIVQCDQLRVKPEPREGWAPARLVYPAKELAKMCGWNEEDLVHVREVL